MTSAPKKEDDNTATQSFAVRLKTALNNQSSKQKNTIAAVMILTLVLLITFRIVGGIRKTRTLFESKPATTITDTTKLKQVKP